MPALLPPVETAEPLRTSRPHGVEESEAKNSDLDEEVEEVEPPEEPGRDES